MTVLGERYKIGDVILHEAANFYSRKLCQIDKSQTLKAGQVLQGDVFSGLMAALAADAAAVNQVDTITVTGTMSAGFLAFRIGNYVFEIAYNGTFATALAALNTAIGVVYGGSGKGPVVTSTGGAWNSCDLIFTYSGTAVAGRPITEDVAVDIDGATGVTSAVRVVTTAGVSAAAGTDAVETYNITGTIGTSGVLGLKIQQPNGLFVTVTASTATNAAAWVTAINAAITTAFGTGVGPVVTGSAYTALTLTYSGTAYAKRPITESVEFDFSGTYNSTVGDVTYTYTKTLTTVGVRPTGAAGASAVLLEDVTTSATQYAQANCVIRLATIKPGYLVYGANCTTAAQKAAVNAALGAKGIEVRPSPSFAGTPDANLTETVTTGTGLQGL